MAKKIILELTKAQLNAIMNLSSDIEAMIGCGEGNTDIVWRRNVRLVDRVFENNGYKR